MQKVADLFGKLGFDVPDLMGSGKFVHDYFSAHFEAGTADGSKIQVSAEWLADGKTQLTIRSNLPETQNAYLAGKIREVLTSPAARS